MDLGTHLTAGHRTPIWSLTRQHQLEDGELTLLGAHASVTGAMTRIELGNQRVLVDCGVPQGLSAEDWRFDEAALDVGAVFLTHAHNDHIGSLPTLIEGGYAGPIYGTPATLEVALLVLEDGLTQQGMSRADVGRTIRQIDTLMRPLPYGLTHDLGGGVECAFREAGHMLGSASLELWSRRSRVICSGDLGRPGSPLLPDYNTAWRNGRPVDLVLMESTYGDQDHQHGHGDVERELERILLHAIERRGHVVVPAFAIGRTQSLLHHLQALVAARRIPVIPLAIDGPLGINVTKTYSDFARLFDRESLSRVASGMEALDLEGAFQAQSLANGQHLSEMAGPLLILAGHGMCTGGRIIGHLRRLLPLEQTTLLFIGYQAEGTPGRAIQRAASRGGRVWLDHEEVRVRATVETLDGLSAHADRSELARWLRAIPDVRRIALHHGEPKAQRSFANWYG
jgi:metallo-beta-lactamase family protein